MNGITEAERMAKLIYVFSEEDKGRMLDMGYVLMSEDVRNHVFVFRLGDKAKFADLRDSGVQYLESNTLTL